MSEATSTTEDSNTTTRRSFAEVLSTPVVVPVPIPEIEEPSQDKADEGSQNTFAEMRYDGNLLVLRKRRQFRDNEGRACTSRRVPPSRPSGQ